MDQVYSYLGLAAWWGIVVGLSVCFLILLGYMLWHKQWLNFFLSIFFLPACGGGFVLPLVIGWQEAKNWNIKNLMRIYTVLVVFGFFIMGHYVWMDLTTKEETIDPRSAKGKRAMAKGKGVPPPAIKGPGASPFPKR